MLRMFCRNELVKKPEVGVVFLLLVLLLMLLWLVLLFSWLFCMCLVLYTRSSLLLILLLSTWLCTIFIPPLLLNCWCWHINCCWNCWGCRLELITKKSLLLNNGCDLYNIWLLIIGFDFGLNNELFSKNYWLLARILNGSVVCWGIGWNGIGVEG